MKKTLKRTLAVLMIIMTIMSSVSVLAVNAAETTLPTKGKIGKNVSYTFNKKTGEVKISGTGATYNYDAFSASKHYNPSPFNRKSEIVSVVIDKGITSIGDCLFMLCKNLNNVKLPYGIKTIGKNAFRSCSKIKLIDIPESVSTVKGGAFYLCSLLEDIKIPDSVYSIGEKAFAETDWYSRQQKNTLVYAGKVAYKFKGSVPKNTEIVIKDGTLGVAANAFSNDSNNNIVDIKIPDSVKTIGYHAFMGCASLKSIVLPSSLKSIDRPFANCTKLNKIYYKGTKAQWIKIAGYESVTAVNHAQIVYCAVSKITYTATKSTVKLDWNKVNGAAGYRVYQYNPSTGKYEVVVKATSATSATIKNLKANKTYLFAVCTYFKEGKNYIWADNKYIKISTKAPATPTVKLATTAKGRATIAWTNVKGETGYQVYYSTKKDSGYKKIANFAADTTKTYKKGLTSGKTYYFRVRAYTKVTGGYVYGSYSSAKAIKIK